MLRFVLVGLLFTVSTAVSAQVAATVNAEGYLVVQPDLTDRVDSGMRERMLEAGPGSTLILEGSGYTIREPQVSRTVVPADAVAFVPPGTVSAVSYQTATTSVTPNQSRALAFRAEAVRGYVDRESDESARHWYQLEQGSRVTDARIKQMEVDSLNRLRQQELREREAQHRRWEELARRREAARRQREADDLRREQIEAQRNRETRQEIRKIAEDFRRNLNR